MLPDHRDWLGRGNIESRSPILLPIGSVEESADLLLKVRGTFFGLGLPEP